jgi:uncharacterized protein (TIGR02300 family)
VTKPEWGKKRICQSCGAPFYDLKRKTITCPRCGAAFDPTPPAKSKRAAQPAPAPKPVPKPVPVPAVVADVVPADDEDLDAIDEEADDDDEPPATEPGGLSAKKAAGGEERELIEDASDLGEDEDDIGEVKEHIDDGIADKP